MVTEMQNTILTSVVTDTHLFYPSAEDYFSPSVEYPEYKLGHVSREENVVYGGVRRSFWQACLDRDHFGSHEWNPLGRFIKPGQRVFVLCNFVYHQRRHESKSDFLAKCTHGSVVRAAVDYILKATGPRGQVFVGNAPLQSCKWTSVLRDTGTERLLEFYRDRQLPVEGSDLRLLVAERGATGLPGHTERRGNKDCIAVDLGADSLISQLGDENTHFRVRDYDYRRTEACHRVGKHVYLLNRGILQSNVIFSIPKLKTHEKVGITCAIKGCVGAVGHKDSLAHHRFGSPKQGGDEYPSDSLGIRRRLSYLHDSIQTSSLQSGLGRWLRVFDRVLRRAIRPLTPHGGGAWWGNDTCWRMAVDLSTILAYADDKGILQDIPARKHLALVDGIVGGEGQGPLAPKPVRSGVLIFGNNIVSVDRAAAIMMGYDPQKLSIVMGAMGLKKYPMPPHSPAKDNVFCNGAQVSLDDLKAYVVRRYVPPSGWKKYL